MVNIQSGLLSYLYAVPEETCMWLLGRDVESVLNAVACDSLYDDTHIKPMLPGNVRITGLFLASETIADLSELSANVKSFPKLLLIRSLRVCKAYLITAESTEETDLRVEDAIPYSLIHSKTSLVLRSLDSLEVFAVVNKSVNFEICGQMVSLSEPGETELMSVIKKLGKQKNVNVEAGIWYAATMPIGEHYDAPALTLSAGTTIYDLQIDWTTVFSLSDTLSDVLEAHLYKLKELADYMMDQLKQHRDLQMICLSFQNSYCPHPFHGLYFLNEEAYSLGDGAEYLKAQRKALHELLRLPLDWPLVRQVSVLNLRGENEGKLQNVHEQLMIPSPGDLGEKIVCKGRYVYYHYNQDSFDDRGWGCAYRSLQTIWSWFLEQHYTQFEVPSHYLIQKMLVDASDKPKEFLGSKEWIGSFEISLCLDMRLGVQSKILSVKSGPDLADHGRELAQHFREQGTPVMIGGGVLAYTLLGVDYDETSGGVRFLILDPHFTGSDNLKSVLDKGFCAWKTASLFKADTFYNLCLPQRPAYY